MRGRPPTDLGIIAGGSRPERRVEFLGRGDEQHGLNGFLAMAAIFTLHFFGEQQHERAGVVRPSYHRSSPKAKMFVRPAQGRYHRAGTFLGLATLEQGLRGDHPDIGVFVVERSSRPPLLLHLVACRR